MPTDLEKLPLLMPRSSGVSFQTQRGLIDIGEHPTITKVPTEAAPVTPGVAPGPGNTKGKSSLEVMAESTGKTIEQYKAEQDARNRALFEKRGLKYPPQ